MTNITTLQAQKIQKTATICISVVLGMLALTFISVPLYDLFCRTTGFNGTPLVRSTHSETILDQRVNVRFDANVSPQLQWEFTPETNEIELKLGETKTVFYKVTNRGKSQSTGIASYNVEPELAGGYFIKIQCFCFNEQTLEPGESLNSAVVFYVDPTLAKDQDVKNLDTITLSYTFFPAKNKSSEQVATINSNTKSSKE